MHSSYQNRDVSKEIVRDISLSMETIFFPNLLCISIAYTRYNLSHLGRVVLRLDTSSHWVSVVEACIDDWSRHRMQ